MLLLFHLLLINIIEKTIASTTLSASTNQYAGLIELNGKVYLSFTFLSNVFAQPDLICCKTNAEIHLIHQEIRLLKDENQNQNKEIALLKKKMIQQEQQHQPNRRVKRPIRLIPSE